MEIESLLIGFLSGIILTQYLSKHLEILVRRRGTEEKKQSEDYKPD